MANLQWYSDYCINSITINSITVIAINCIHLVISNVGNSSINSIVYY